MKKFLAFLILVSSAVMVQAASPTFTPTATPTHSPTITPTWTPTQQAQEDTDLQREQVYAQQRITLDDGASRPVLTPVADGVWYAQAYKQSVFVMSSGTSKARFEWRLPNNYKPKMPLKIWAYGFYSVTNAAAVSVSLSVNIGMVGFGKLTSTATEYQSITINPQTANFGRLMDNRWCRFLWPTPASLTQSALATSMNFQLVRTGTLGDLNIAYMELEWDPSFMQQAELPETPSLRNVFARPEDFIGISKAIVKRPEEI